MPGPASPTTSIPETPLSRRLRARLVITRSHLAPWLVPVVGTIARFNVTGRPARA